MRGGFEVRAGQRRGRGARPAVVRAVSELAPPNKVPPLRFSALTMRDVSVLVCAPTMDEPMALVV